MYAAIPATVIVRFCGLHVVLVFDDEKVVLLVALQFEKTFDTIQEYLPASTIACGENFDVVNFVLKNFGEFCVLLVIINAPCPPSAQLAFGLCISCLYFTRCNIIASTLLNRFVDLLRLFAFVFIQISVFYICIKRRLLRIK